MRKKGKFGGVFREIAWLTLLLCGCSVTAESDPAAREAEALCFKQREMSPGYTGKLWWGMFTEKRPLKEIPALQAIQSQYPADHSVGVIRYITPGGVGEAEGLEPGDILVEKPVFSSTSSRPGETIKLKVWRQKERKLCDLAVKLPQYYRVGYSPYRKPAAAAEFEKELPPGWDIYAGMLMHEPIRENLDDLLQRLTDIDCLTDAYRLPIFRYLIRNPFRLEQVSRGWTGRVAAAKEWRELLPLSEYMLEFAPPSSEELVRQWTAAHPSPGENASVEEIVGYYLQVLRRCAELHKQAFGKIGEEDLKFVRQYRHDALESICKYHMLSYEPDVASARRTLRLFEILNRIDRTALFAQAQTAALLGDERLLARLKELFAGRNGLLYQKETDCGKVAISGFGDDYHTRDAALLIDLGGNDVYLNNQATPKLGAFPTAVIVDCGGDDYYSSTDAASQGCGDLGVGMLLDLAGNDTYAGIEMVQGTAFGGIGVLYDRSGDDVYRAIRMSQATAFFGAGLLIDQAGCDQYTVQHFGQALGSVRGIGLLVDGEGDDRYVCKGNRQTSYATRGHFDGWGQGTGFGVRPFASGGIGILLDKSGSDRYDGGTFTQGGGYYYSYGICNDRGKESDLYLGTRYSQGFAAHQALGAFIEHGGNDVYRTHYGVSLGISWDETVVLFADDQGDDDYHSGLGTTSYSAVHQNGICFFFDRNGDDRYAKGYPVPPSTNNYHLGTSLGIFVDSGGGDDRYLKRQNNTRLTEAGDHIFIDQ